MDFKPEVGQSLRWSFAMQVGRTFSLRTEEVLRLLEMVKNYDRERGEILASEPRSAQPAAPLSAFPPPSAQMRMAFAKILIQQIALDEETVNQIIVCLQNYDQARSEILDNYAKLVSELTAISPPRPVVFAQASGNIDPLEGLEGKRFTPAPGYFCNKCGYVGPEREHPGCNYSAAPIETAHG